MIVLAAASILVTAIQKWRRGLTLENLGNGVVIIIVAGLLNAGLGWYLLRVGRRNHSLMVFKRLEMCCHFRRHSEIETRRSSSNVARLCASPSAMVWGTISVLQ